MRYLLYVPVLAVVALFFGFEYLSTLVLRCSEYIIEEIEAVTKMPPFKWFWEKLS